MSIHAPEKHWWKPMDKEELIWLSIAFIWCQFITFIMPYAHVYGDHNPPGETIKTTPEEFGDLVDKFIEANTVGEKNGMPVVEVGADVKDVYMIGRNYQWEPVLKLQKGKEYRLHLSSADWQHGFSLMPMNLNMMALPGYDYVLKITPNTTGEHVVICNEFCGAGHHVMSGMIIVN